MHKETLRPGRRVGNTTRMIDNAIQELFENGKARMVDHFDTRDLTVRWRAIVSQRLRYEHHLKLEDFTFEGEWCILLRYQKPILDDTTKGKER